MKYTMSGKQQVVPNGPNAKNKQGLKLSTSIKDYFKQQTEASFPTGSSDFIQMVTQRSIFVDKTLLIKKIIDINEKAIVITRPRRWGKSSNMDMLYYFFNMEVDEQGKALNPQPHRVLFTGGETQALIKNMEQTVTLKPLKISSVKDNGKTYIDYQGSSPVIYMSWIDIRRDKFDDFKEAVQVTIANEFSRCRYLLKVLNKQSKIDDFELKKFESLASQTAPEQTLIQSLKFLTELLFRCHGKRAYILIDEFDAPFNYLLDQELTTNDPTTLKHLQEERRRVSLMISGVLSAALNGNEYLQKGILTGVLDSLDTASGLNNLIKYRITDKRLHQFYGFSKEEVETQLVSKILKEEAPQHLKEELLNKVTEWYSGYTVPETNGSYSTVYNAFAVILYLYKCIRSKMIATGDQYWSDSGSYVLWDKFFSSQHKNIGKLLCLDTTEPVTLQFDEDFKLTDFDFSNNKYIMHILLHSGYITGRIKGGFIQALIPNKDILSSYKEVLRDWVTYNDILKDRSQINLNDPKNLQTKMLRTINQIQGFLDWKNDRVFGFLFQTRYLLFYNETHYVSNKLYSGSGYINNLFYPKEALKTQDGQDEQDRFYAKLAQEGRRNTIIIHEYKFTVDSQNKRKLYNDALWQVYEKGYLHQPLTVMKKKKKIRKIIVRPIVILQDKSKQSQVSIYMEKDILHSIVQAERICDYFSKKSTVETLRLRDENRKENQCRVALLEKEEVNDIHQLLKKIIELKANDKGKQQKGMKTDKLRSNKEESVLGKRSFKKDEKGRYQPKVSAEDVLQAIGGFDPRDLEKVYKKVEELKKDPNFYFNPKTFEAKKEEMSYQSLFFLIFRQRNSFFNLPNCTSFVIPISSDLAMTITSSLFNRTLQ